MMNKNNFCVIMGGGIGSRFWPCSKTSKPKQFLDIFGTGRSLLQMTFDRFSSFIPTENIIIVTNKIYKDLVLEQLPMLREEQVLLEPMRRNTAPCIAYASFHIKAKNPNANIVVTPSDHLILNEQEFTRCVETALNYTAENRDLLTLGVCPSRPETGYGYIQMKKDVEIAHPEIKKVKTFTEKPSREIAEKFVESGDFLWNSGMFVWHIEAIMKAFEEHLYEVYELFEEHSDCFATESEMSEIAKIFPMSPSISIDYGIMEKSENVMVLPVDFGWADLGTWTSIYDLKEKDEAENVTIRGNAMYYESKGNIVSMEDPESLVVVQGLDDCIVAQSENVLLICKRSEEQRIKDFMSEAGERFEEKYS